MTATGTALVHGTGQTSVIGIILAAGVLVMDVAFSLIAAPLLKTLDPVMVAACGCALAAGMLTGYSAATETQLWRLPTAQEASVIAFLGIVLSAAGFGMWFRGLQLSAVDKVAPTISLVPITALTATAIIDATAPAPAQLAGVALAVYGMLLALPTARPGTPIAASSRQAHHNDGATNPQRAGWQHMTFPIRR